MISFENIKTGEIVSFEGGQDSGSRQAHMAAFINSSDMSPNASKGQDFGWRLSPEVKARVELMKTDLETMTAIAKKIGVPIDEIKDFHVLNHLAEQEFSQEALTQAAKGQESKHEKSYNERLEAAKEAQTVKKDVSTTPKK